MVIISISLVQDRLMEIHLLSGMVNAQNYFIDGLQLGPGYFGFTDPLTGTWRPKKFRAEGTTINDGRTWSDNTTGTWDPTYVRTRLFDGNLGTQAYAASGSNAAAITFSDITITQDNRLRVYGGSGWSNEHSITSNGVTRTWNTSNTTVCLILLTCSQLHEF